MARGGPCGLKDGHRGHHLSPEAVARHGEANRRWREANHEKYRASARKYYESNREREYARQKAYRRAEPDRSWRNHLRRKYGITVEEYFAMYEAQGGCCYICRRATGKTKRLSVDHDHRYKGSPRDAIRGLLCSKCNRTLGHLRDDLEAARRIVKYLKNPPARKVLATKGNKCQTTA